MSVRGRWSWAIPALLLLACAPAATARPAPTASPAASAATTSGVTTPIVFVRATPPIEQRRSVDACAYPSEIGRACVDAIGREPDPVRAKYMRRIAAAHLGRGPAITSATHAEIAECCNRAGPCGAQKRSGHADCPTMDDGYSCLVAAELAKSDVLHARACQCDATHAQVPTPGGTLACDGDKPAHREAIEDADDIVACATCTSPAACEAEIARVEPDVAAFIRRVVVKRCQLP